MKITIASLLLSLSYFTGLTAQSSYEKCRFVSTTGDSLNYCLLTPETLDEQSSYPLVLFLHGAGERGSDNQRQLTHGGNMWLNPVNREKYPTFVIVPQCPESGYWAYSSRPKSFIPSEMPLDEAITPIFITLKELLDFYLRMPQVDKKRIYIVGLSMGAMATFDLVIRYPELFAAAVPICGTVNPERLDRAKSVKFRIFHGDDDNVVPVEGSREAYKALKSVGAEVDYIELPGVNHGSWTAAFNDNKFMEWLFSQRQ